MSSCCKLSKENSQELSWVLGFSRTNSDEKVQMALSWKPERCLESSANALNGCELY